MKPAQQPLQGIALLLLAVACFATLDSTVKYLSLSLPVLLAVWFRYLFQALAMSAVVLPTRGSSPRLASKRFSARCSCASAW